MRENSEIVDIVISLYKQKGWSLSEFARKLGMPKSSLSRYLNKNRQFPVNKTEIFADKLNTTVEYILGLELENQSIPSSDAKNDTIQAINDTAIQLHPKRQENVLEYATEQLEEQKKTTREIQEEPAEYNSDKIIAFPPKYDYDFYDSAISAGTGQYLGDVQKETISLPIDVDVDFVIPVYGRSMEPEYYTGDYVFVKLSVDLKDGDIGVFDYYGDAYIKQLVIDEDGAYLHSFNPEYPDMPIDADTDFRIIGEVVSVYREN
ncbi:LexA family transcriptional regulator [Streptococcus acidominimus]|uniref:Phage transcriptional repressor n=1 Tax=Streptococcus acidominimus TaxID=1326 RepID=A0A1Q8EFN8_STRAI|nr:XRE family transcriptional regulator [Streptococcus acidominimus]OLF50625.1 hypothetical protein BU200_00965 [Streptococcus acidominimus]QBX13644.1 transcriptional repressor [Streptococcus phage Javan1]SUN05238.1 phage transcriptional repressor [Streptococcus acidominimus]SUN41225.1 phage transcriptional repressor [Streptococcus acidominimus]